MGITNNKQFTNSEMKKITLKIGGKMKFGRGERVDNLKIKLIRKIFHRMDKIKIWIFI